MEFLYICKFIFISVKQLKQWWKFLLHIYINTFSYRDNNNGILLLSILKNIDFGFTKCYFLNCFKVKTSWLSIQETPISRILKLKSWAFIQTSSNKLTFKARRFIIRKRNKIKYPHVKEFAKLRTLTPACLIPQ